MKGIAIAVLLLSSLSAAFGQSDAPTGAAAKPVAASASAQSGARLVKAASGPSGKTVGERFLFNEERNRFLIPRDKSMVVYMEWEGVPGEHKITGVWKRPDGSTGFLSSDIELVSEGPRFSAYWTFYLNPGMESGIWQLEALVDGSPAGAYPFEVVAPDLPEPVIEAKVTPKLPTLDDLYARRNSLVWIHRLDDGGHRLATMTGFVVSEGVVATSFQAIDVADGLEAEFADGRVSVVTEVLAYSTADDWALLKADTREVEALVAVEESEVAIGERLVAFNAEAQATRVIGGVDYSGRKSSGKLERFVFAPGLSDEAMGGPLLDTKGNVVGLLSGCIAPGTRLGGASRLLGGVGARLCTRNTAVPVKPVLAGLQGTPQTFTALKSTNVITAPVRKLDAFLHGGTRRPDDAREQRRRMGRLALDDEAEFTRSDGQVAVYSWWQQPDHVKKQPPIVIGARVYDSENQLRVDVEPKSVKVRKNNPVEYVFTFPVATLSAGIYRIDTLADGVCVWRTFIELRD